MRCLRIACLMGIALLAAACGDGIAGGCQDDLGWKYSPHDTTIAAGEQFTAALSLYGCGGRERLVDTVTFASSDISVAVVGTTTGVVIGTRPGTAVITATAKHYRTEVPIQVSVH